MDRIPSVGRALRALRLRWRFGRARFRARRRRRLAGRRGGTRMAGTDVSTVPPLVAFSLAAPVIALSLMAAHVTLDRWPAGAGEAAAGTLIAQHSQADLALRPVQVLRWKETERFARQFGISIELSRLIYDRAKDHGLEPELAFRLVRVESGFRKRAVGPFGSIGYTQVQMATARWLDSTVTRDRLFEAETNLDLGFRYLRMLLDSYSGNTRLALLAYNRGPGTVAALLAVGQDPSNGYDNRVLGRGDEPVRIARLEREREDRQADRE